jgi:hypothetical protein
VDFVSTIGSPPHAVDVTLHRVTAVSIERELEVLFRGEGFTVREGRVPPVIVRQAGLAVKQVVSLCRSAANDFDPSSPLLPPFLPVELQNLIERMGLAPAEILIQFLQTLVDPLPEKCLHALLVGLFDPVDVLEPITERTVFERLEFGVRKDKHGRGPDEDYL